jgi:hypothetical protein
MKRNYMNKSKLFWLIIYLLSTLSLLSCKSQKTISSTPNRAIADTIQIKTVLVSDSIINKMTENQFNFEWLSAKFTADYETDNNNTSFSGQIRIRKDSLIWISISKFSIEGARILITQDSIFVINRMDNNYFKSDFNYINRFINSTVDFDMLQAFIVGNDFKYYEKNKFKTSFDGENFQLNTINRHKLKKYIRNENEKLKILVQNIEINPKTYKIINLNVKEVKENNKLKISYSDFENINNQLLAKILQISIISEKVIGIKLEYSKVNLNEELNFPFKIPENYERIIPK